MTRNDPWLEPQLCCDIVMKGGITSGVVYPGGVVELARRYRFCGVGGTSAGAIAAAAVAAAEYGRQSGGFAKLAAIPERIAADVDGDPFILTLFQPEPATRPLFDAALAFQRGLGRGVGQLLRSFPRFPLAAAALAVLAIVLAAFDVIPWALAIVGLAIAPWILVVGILRDALAAFRALADNDFGLCRLGSREKGPQALTGWLHGVIQELADKAEPLTFADLWGVPPLTGFETEEERERRRLRLERLGWQARKRRIDLQIVTTNLTQGRPIRLPLTRDRWRDTYADGGLFFDPDEWSRFFPPSVVAHMVAHGEPPSPEQAEIMGEAAGRLVAFDFSGELPILVAARMSLSFPVLISTVPLWQIQYRKSRPPRLRRMVFSDGGISSNFPVQLFDSPLPTRPTFAVNLAGFEDDEEPDLDDPGACVTLPAKAAGRAVENWKQPESMFGFFLAIKDAAQNWRDNTQSRMPGFRERVVHIKLARREGGLNLAMDEKKVRRLTARGRHAGRELVTLFSGSDDEPTPTEHWNDHRYARFRTLLSSLERFVADLERGYRATPDAASIPFPTRIQEGATKGPYAMSAARLEAAEAILARYLELADDVAETLDDNAVPRPRASVRITPPL